MLTQGLVFSLPNSAPQKFQTWTKLNASFRAQAFSLPTTPRWNKKFGFRAPIYNANAPIYNANLQRQRIDLQRVGHVKWRVGVVNWRIGVVNWRSKSKLFILGWGTKL